jgi:hypothetical protein
LGRRTQLSPSVVTVEAEGGTAQGGRLEARSRRCTPVRWPHRTEPLLASWLRRACCAALVTGFFFSAARIRTGVWRRKPDGWGSALGLWTKQSVTQHIRIWLFCPPNQRLPKPVAWGLALWLSDTSETVSHSTYENLAILPTKPASS